MKVNIIKDHEVYPLGEVEVDEDRARYLIAVGVAEEIKYKEKPENKKGNVPTAKKKK